MTVNSTDEWPYENVERGEIRGAMTPEECKELRQELDRLRQLEEKWSCDRCGENKATATKGDEHLCNSCIFG